MNRREFLQKLLAAGAVVAAPKFIFDYGANLYKQKTVDYLPIDDMIKAIQEMNQVIWYTAKMADQIIYLPIYT